MTLAKWLALLGLALDIVGAVIIGLRSERWMVQFWRSAPARFDTQAHKVLYQAAWWAIVLGFGLQALAVLVQ